MMATQQAPKFSALVAPRFLARGRTGMTPKWYRPSADKTAQCQPYAEASLVVRSSMDCQEIVTVRAPSA